MKATVTAPGERKIHIGTVLPKSKLGSLDWPFVRTYCGMTLPKTAPPEPSVAGFGFCWACVRKDNDRRADAAQQIRQARQELDA